MAVLLSILIIFLVLVINEFWWRNQPVHNEFSRKFIHISVGGFVAFWPFYLSWQQIEILSVAFVVCVGISKYFKIFQAIHSVQRPTWGEVFFAAAVGIIALVTHDKWVYAVSLLQMALADGLAAIIGVRYGNRRRYIVTGHAKSLVGTSTFFVVSLAILAIANHWGELPLTLGYAVAISAVASALENVAARGFDNLIVPLVVALMLINR